MANPENLHKTYSEVVQFIQDFQLKLPVEHKTLASFVFKCSELKKIKEHLMQIM